jgi:predicted LPLAT superfamily acyltransferase
MTGAPVVMAFGLFEGGRRYRIVFEPLAGRVVPDGEQAGEPGPAGMASATLSTTLARYVSNLERQARLRPFNWFNFYDYWERRP